MERLRPSLRRVIELRHKHECSIKQITEMTGLSISATETRLHRARYALRQRLRSNALGSTDLRCGEIPHGRVVVYSDK